MHTLFSPGTIFPPRFKTFTTWTKWCWVVKLARVVRNQVSSCTDISDNFAKCKMAESERIDAWLYMYMPCTLINIPPSPSGLTNENSLGFIRWKSRALSETELCFYILVPFMGFLIILTCNWSETSLSCNSSSQKCKCP